MTLLGDKLHPLREKANGIATLRGQWHSELDRLEDCFSLSPQ